MKLNKEETSLVNGAVAQYYRKICPRCEGYLHSLPQETRQDFCFGCGIQWTLAELEDFCMEEIKKLMMRKFTENVFISWCLSKFKQGVLNEINL